MNNNRIKTAYHTKKELDGTFKLGEQLTTEQTAKINRMTSLSIASLKVGYAPMPYYLAYHGEKNVNRVYYLVQLD